MYVTRVFSFVFLLLVAGCVSGGRPATYTAHPDSPYFLDSGDLVQVTVFGQLDLSRIYNINDAGYISMPLVGTIAARGATTNELASRITRAYAAGYLVDPDVGVEVQTYRPFFIQGAVVAAGSFPYMAGMTVRKAISVAGGYTRTADRSTAIIYRSQNGRIAKGKVALDLPIFPGDTIEISERWL